MAITAKLFVFIAVCSIFAIKHSNAQLVASDSVRDEQAANDFQSKVSVDHLNQCYQAGIESARILLIAQYPVVNKRNPKLTLPLPKSTTVTDAPITEGQVSGESKPRSRDTSYYGALSEGMVRCLTSLYLLTVDEVRRLVSLELSKESLLGESCLIPEEVTIAMDDSSVLVDSGNDKIQPMTKIVESMLDTTNPCTIYPFRTFTGYCNNPRHPERGMSFRPFRRLLPAAYDDGISSPRTTSRVTGNALPNARLVSNAVHNTKRKTQEHVATHMVMQWGQLLDHDLTHTPQTTDARGKIAKCCGETPPNRNPECFPVQVPEDDYFFKHGKKCLEFVRSMPTSRPGCRLGPREQINQLTQYLDGSVIYGSTEAEANLLRSFKNGFLRTQASGPRDHGADALPLDLFHQDCLNFYTHKNSECLRAGDLRVNEQTGLSAMHLILTREHNRVAAELQKINPHWNDERLFQEARKIVGAEQQHITYDKWLPLVVGPDTIKHYRLNLLSKGYSTDYDMNEDATIGNVFASVAFRFGHTLIQGSFELFSNRNRLMGKLDLINMFNQPYHLHEKNFTDEMIKGLCVQRAQMFDRHIDNQVMDHLFEEPPGVEGKGQDLIARNIQRARDHGIPPYVDWRRKCKLEVPRDFDHLREMNIIDPEAVNIMESVYDSVEDVDAFPGFMSERSLPGSLVGPMLGCIFGFTFKQAKISDRFWYENGVNLPNVFTIDQLTQLRKSTLARILCDNNDGGIRRMQPNVFMDANTASNNAMVPCTKIPTVDLSPWKENPNDTDALAIVASAMLRKPHTPEEDSVQVLFTKSRERATEGLAEVFKAAEVYT